MAEIHMTEATVFLVTWRQEFTVPDKADKLVFLMTMSEATK